MVRNFLRPSRAGGRLPRPAEILAEFNRFQAALPAIAAGIDFKVEELRGFKDFPTFAECVVDFLTVPPCEGWYGSERHVVTKGYSDNGLNYGVAAAPRPGMPR
jgi:hypothetical protein